MTCSSFHAKSVTSSPSNVNSRNTACALESALPSSPFTPAGSSPAAGSETGAQPMTATPSGASTEKSLAGFMAALLSLCIGLLRHDGALLQRLLGDRIDDAIEARTGVPNRFGREAGRKSTAA